MNPYHNTLNILESPYYKETANSIGATKSVAEKVNLVAEVGDSDAQFIGPCLYITQTYQQLPMVYTLANSWLSLVGTLLHKSVTLERCLATRLKEI